MAASSRTRVVVTDVLINLIHVGRLELLGALVGFEFVVPPEVEWTQRSEGQFQAAESRQTANPSTTISTRLDFPPVPA